jgi:hypothetical protein
VCFVLNVREGVNIHKEKAVKVKEWQYTGPSGNIRACTIHSNINILILTYYDLEALTYIKIDILDSITRGILS